MNTDSPPPRKLSRRYLLKIAAATGITVALGDALLTYAPWMDYNGQSQQTWDTPFGIESNASAQMQELVRYATLAPSSHNTQPWRFAILGNTIRISPDYARRLPIVDPQDRELWISLGCALENLVIAAQHAGYECEITYPKLDADYLTLRLTSSSAQSTLSLFEAIPHRQNTRSLYDGHAVPSSELRKIDDITPSAGVSLQIFTETSQKEAILEYIKTGNQRQYGNQAFVSELVSWLRFNKPEALHTLDGLYTKCSGNPEIPRWLGKRLLTTASAGQQSGTDVNNVRSSAGVIVISAAQDDKQHWIETGRLYERLALTLTVSNIKMAFLNQPIEVATLRSQFQSYLSLGTAQPQLLLRFGYADLMPRSLRRPLSQVIA